MASALQCSSNHALVLWAAAGFLPVHYFCVRGHKAAQCLPVFIVYGRNLVCAEVAILLYNWDIFISLLRSHKCKYLVVSIKQTTD